MAPSLQRDVCPEKKLLLYCARSRTRPGLAQTIRDLTTGEIDWDFLLSDAHEHCVLPLLERQLRNAAPDAIPSVFAERLKQEARANAVRCLALLAELIRVMELFESRGVPAIPYKGPAIAAQAYGDITLREFEDLDIVVRQRDLAALHEAVCGVGYEPRFPWIHSSGRPASLIPGEYNYANSERRVVLELHTEFTLRHFPIAPRLDDFIERAVKVDLGGREVATFSPEDALLFLCVHGAKDFWQKLVWIADIAELVQSFPAMDWSAVRRRSAQLRAERMLDLGLALAADLLEVELPPEIEVQVRSDAVAGGLAAALGANLLARDSKPMSARERFRFRRQLVPGNAAGWHYASRLALAPAEDDWLLMRLPRPLTPLYFLLRPFRLLRKYG
ncbi:MAG TPA: nucleotidyltransferase family protein [Candidatus Acidoferrum sp.]|nr:nucleotidyltransferase family protein [Candidatus Acidoferrum sp.]